MMLSGIFIEDNIGQFTLMIVGVFFLLCRIVFPILPAVISKKEPILDSYFKLMLSGGDRKFKFNKSDETSIKIADFINKVEDTLTAYKQMSGFWDIFKKTAYFRASWHIQDLLIDSYNKIRYNLEKAEQMRSMRENRKEINTALNDNAFARKRKKN